MNSEKFLPTWKLHLYEDLVVQTFSAKIERVSCWGQILMGCFIENHVNKMFSNDGLICCSGIKMAPPNSESF